MTGGIWQGTLQDTVRARGVPGVDLDVTPRAVTEDGFQGLTYAFSRPSATSTPLTVNYVLGGSATQAIDFTGLPAGSGTRSITIPAGATTASLTVFPTPDSEIEPDETVVLTLLPGTGYALGSKTVATGTIENDDYLLDLILDGLPEETVPGPNELSPGAVLSVGGGRVSLIAAVPAGRTATLSIAQDSDKVRVYREATGGTPVLEEGRESMLIVGGPPQQFYVEAMAPSLIQGDIQFLLVSGGSSFFDRVGFPVPGDMRVQEQG